MKILLVNKFFYLRGGAERVFFQERQSLHDRGHQVMEFAMRHPQNVSSDYESYFPSHIDYHEKMGIGRKLSVAAKFVHSSEAVRNIKTLVRRHRPDVAHMHNIYHQLTPSIVTALKQLDVPILLTVHDAKLVCPSYLMLRRGKPCDLCRDHGIRNVLLTNCQNSVFKNTLLLIEAAWHRWKKSYQNIDVFLTPSVFYSKLISKCVPQHKTKILPNGIDIGSFEPRYDHDGYILYFGRLSQEKGINTLLEAHAIHECGFPLKIVGNGPLEDYLRGAYPTIEFLGYRGGGDLKDIARGAACVVIPSECYENCSMVILESMALGKPVICSRIGGIPEQVVDGKTGFFFEPGNVLDLAGKLDLLLSSENLIQNMGKAARKRAERKYSLEKHLDTLIDIYAEMVG